MIDATGLTLAPGFIDVHTHDDTHVVRSPQMWPKLSQGVTTVIVGNCGISAAPAALHGEPPDPMNLLGEADAFLYPTFAELRGRGRTRAAGGERRRARRAHGAAQQSDGPARSRRDAAEIDGDARRAREALDHGALGLELRARVRERLRAPTEEVMALAEPLADAGALYTTHMRTEFDAILDAMDEAFRVGRHARVPVVDFAPQVRGAGELGTQRRGARSRWRRRGDARIRSAATAIRTPPARPRST